jgi:hypothetical protein
MDTWVSEYCNINNANLRVAGATVWLWTPWVSEYSNINNTNLRVAGATVWTLEMSPYGNIT